MIQNCCIILLFVSRPQTASSFQSIPLVHEFINVFIIGHFLPVYHILNHIGYQLLILLRCIWHSLSIIVLLCMNSCRFIGILDRIIGLYSQIIFIGGFLYVLIDINMFIRQVVIDHSCIIVSFIINIRLSLLSPGPSSYFLSSLTLSLSWYLYATYVAL